MIPKMPDDLKAATEEIKTPAIKIIIYAAFIIISVLSSSLAIMWRNDLKNSAAEKAALRAENTEYKKEVIGLRIEIVELLKGENQRLQNRQNWQDSINAKIDKITK